MGTINKEFKEKYDVLITRERKAEKWLDAPERTNEQIEKWLPEFTKIIVDLSKMINEYKKLTGKDMSEQLALDDFKDE